jgi:hypothetical protein
MDFFIGRKHFQFWLSTALAAYFFVDAGTNAFAVPRLDYPAAAQNCTWACDVLCNVPQDQFVPMMTNVTSQAYWAPKEAFGSAFPNMYKVPSMVKSHAGPKDVWWCNPHERQVS